MVLVIIGGLLVPMAVLVAAPAAVSAPASASDAPAVIETRVERTMKERGIVALAVGGEAGVEVGDAFYVLGDTGVIGAGTVYFVTPQTCAGKLQGPASAPVDAPASIVRTKAAASLRDHMPPGATIRGQIVRVPPGRQTVWVDLGARTGLRVGDQVLVSRMQLPLGRGRVVILEPHTALVMLDPLVENALAEPGDQVELWPAPVDARLGRLNSAVLKVTAVQDASGLELYNILIPGTATDGLVEGRLVDVFRGRHLVGVATLVQISSPSSWAQMMTSATADTPAEGDRAVVRAAASKDQPLTVPVFKVEGQACLIAAGEFDGIRNGEKFMVRRADAGDPMVLHDVAELTIEHVEVNYAQASVKPLTSQVAGLRLWDMAEREVAGGQGMRTIGIVEVVDAASRSAVASIDPRAVIAPGAVVSWVPETDDPVGAAVVLSRQDDRLVLLVPPGWGKVDRLVHARIEAGR